ncbi:MAG TPA: MHYT domain-containing protein, partial [Longimicrobiales bacterium]|nr:MHYT domain-containing protein [Longimicrobiales bacterium]
MTAHYHPTLVLISVLIAVLASHTALDLTYSLTITRGRARIAWLAAGAFAMGSGIWSMHFTGMLAFRLPGTPISYEINRLVASIVIAIGASALSLFIFTRPRISSGALIVSGLAMGVAISGMHYMGMAGFRAPVLIQWNALLVILSILIAVGASFVALNLAARIRSATRHPIMLKMAGGVIMGLAIAGMHYTGMAAAHFDPAAAAPSAEAKVLATRALAIAVTAASMIILLVSSGASLATRNMARHRYYRALIENASDLIVVVDETGIRK